jgi:hypothetical protein
MPHASALSGWPFYFLNLSTIKKVGAKLDERTATATVTATATAKTEEETDSVKECSNLFLFRQQNSSTADQEQFKCLNCLGVVPSTMEAGLLSINKLLLSVIGQPRGNLVTSQTPITNEFKISDTVLGLGINGKVVECVKKSSGQKFALKVT